MKHKYLYIAALIALSTAHAKLIDLTPGGTVIDYGPPPFIAANGFYDEAEALPYTIYDPNVDNMSLPIYSRTRLRLLQVSRGTLGTAVTGYYTSTYSDSIKQRAPTWQIFTK